MTTLETSYPLVRTDAPHEHAWQVESRHRTSIGAVLYVRCGPCGTRRVDVQGDPDSPPAALSRELSAGAESEEEFSDELG